MAEVAAGVVAAEQAVATTIEAGAATYAVQKPSNGLKASFTQLATTPAEGTRSSLPRSNHSLTVLGNRAYIFGGQTEANKLANCDVHSITLPDAEDKSRLEYHLTPAIALAAGSQVPEARMDHSACVLGDCVAVYGGLDEAGRVLDDPAIWLYDPEKPAWDVIRPRPATAVPCSRSAARIFTHGDGLLLYGGKGAAGGLLADVWLLDVTTRIWARLPDAPVSTSNAALAGGCLYLISANDALSSTLHHLEIAPEDDEPASWDAVQFPTNPLAPGPRARENGGFLSVTTGFGRNYLLYFFGDRTVQGKGATAPPPQWSDMWSLQLPAGEGSGQRTTTLSEAVKPAKIKDAIRSKLGVSTGTFSWAEVEFKPPGDLLEPEGKVHPGPRSSFGCDVLANGYDVTIWGGTNAKGEREGDGWVIHLE